MATIKPTKKSNLSQQFLTLADQDAEGALAFMLMSAFGITLSQIIGVVDKMLTEKNTKVVMLCLTAGVQIRSNVVFVGRDYANMRVEYPTLIIEGDRPQSDYFNFSALHVAGHVLSHLSDHPIAKAILNKAGSCVTGFNTPDSEAGKINKQLYEGWIPEDRVAYQNWSDRVHRDLRTWLSNVIDSIAQRSTTFAGRLRANAPVVSGAIPVAAVIGTTADASAAATSTGSRPPPARPPPT